MPPLFLYRLIIAGQGQKLLKRRLLNPIEDQLAGLEGLIMSPLFHV